ncbi:hypothetical protein [Vogesella oryzae]|uniref:hypothetical protein n=1 Tax=Vogesella oryzae TaxID=1735285 RepID=UPI0015824E56|nr:hypothetical protein [Vogesella oryzae]
MQLSRTIAALLVATMAFSASMSHAEGEDAPLPGDFQPAPIAKPPKAKPLQLPPVSSPAPRVSTQKASEAAPKAGSRKHGKNTTRSAKRLTKASHATAGKPSKHSASSKKARRPTSSRKQLAASTHKASAKKQGARKTPAKISRQRAAKATSPRLRKAQAVASHKAVKQKAQPKRVLKKRKLPHKKSSGK